MKVVQAAVLVAVLVVVSFLVVPPYLDLQRVNTAIAQLETISDAALTYAHHTGTTAPNPEALLSDPGIANWRGPYLDSPAILETPWGGRFAFDLERGLVGIPASNTRAPEKYRFGGIAEISMPIREKPQWWPNDAVLR